MEGSYGTPVEKHCHNHEFHDIMVKKPCFKGYELYFLFSTVIFHKNEAKSSKKLG